jgi:CheY-like chemotaxis protein
VQTILIVENDDAFRYSAAHFLEQAGFNVVAVADTMAGLAAFDGGDKIDLVVLDIHMPTGKPHGPSFARMAKLRHATLPILFITGYPSLVDIEELPGKVLVKPIDFAALVDEIRAGLAAR